jgi:signal transduction histidine kinase
MDNVLEKIYKAGLKFLMPLTPEETYKMVVEEAMKLVKADYGHLLLYKDNKLERVYASSPVFYKIKNRKKGFMFNVFKKRKPIQLELEDVVSIHPRLKELGVKSIIGMPVYNRNKSIGVLGILSMKKDAFKERETNLLKLFSPVASLAIRKAQLYDETVKALEARDLFISMAAHELRTPITTISGYSQLLYSKFAGSDKPEARWVEDLSWETLRLTYLVNELLEVDRIKTGQFHYIWKECRFREIIRRAIVDFQFTHSDYKVVFEDNLGKGKDVIIGDFNKLLQLILNLLDNAAKFSSSDKAIVLTLGVKAGYLFLRVKDSGHGITKKDLPQVFDKYFRGKESREGMGIGLFLVRDIVKQHHGDINIYSKENNGTKVEIKLPITKHD